MDPISSRLIQLAFECLLEGTKACIPPDPMCVCISGRENLQERSDWRRKKMQNEGPQARHSRIRGYPVRHASHPNRQSQCPYPLYSTSSQQQTPHPPTAPRTLLGYNQPLAARSQISYQGSRDVRFGLFVLVLYHNICSSPPVHRLHARPTKFRHQSRHTVGPPAP